MLREWTTGQAYSIQEIYLPFIFGDVPVKPHRIAVVLNHWTIQWDANNKGAPAPRKGGDRPSTALWLKRMPWNGPRTFAGLVECAAPPSW